MKKDQRYHDIVQSLRKDGFAKCKDWVVREWFGCKRISDRHLKVLAQFLAIDSRRQVRAYNPKQNNRDFMFRFFCVEQYDAHTGKPPPARTFSLEKGRQQQRAGAFLLKNTRR